ncbi:MAG TPA: hypothetical protein VK066_09895 [Chloroflexota bacterium]|nr:hypothetical protein [Chloroflexota bacterium]
MVDEQATGRAIPEPILNWTLRLADEAGHAAPGCEPWRTLGQHDAWVGRYPTAHPPLRVQEMHAGRCAEFAKAGYLMHRVAAGTPYRISRLFGFWHISDADLTWLQVQRGDLTLYLALAGGATGLRGDHAVAWYCARCGHEIARQAFARAGRTGAFLAERSRAAVAAFNATAEGRRCPACGWEHPPAYPFSPLDPQAADAPPPPW